MAQKDILINMNAISLESATTSTARVLWAAFYVAKKNVKTFMRYQRMIQETQREGQIQWSVF